MNSTSRYTPVKWRALHSPFIGRNLTVNFEGTTYLHYGKEDLKLRGSYFLEST